MCCNWQTTFIHKNPLELVSSYSHTHMLYPPPPFPIQTLVDSWHGKTWIERFCNHYSVNIRKSSYFIVYSNWSNSRDFFIVFMTLGISIACFHLHRLVSLLTFVGIRSCQISNLVKVNTHNKYSESSVKILSKIMSKLQ